MSKENGRSAMDESADHEERRSDVGDGNGLREQSPYRTLTPAQLSKSDQPLDQHDVEETRHRRGVVGPGAGGERAHAEKERRERQGEAGLTSQDDGLE